MISERTCQEAFITIGGEIGMMDKAILAKELGHALRVARESRKSLEAQRRKLEEMSF